MTDLGEKAFIHSFSRMESLRWCKLPPAITIVYLAIEQMAGEHTFSYFHKSENATSEVITHIEQLHSWLNHNDCWTSQEVHYVHMYKDKGMPPLGASTQHCSKMVEKTMREISAEELILVDRASEQALLKTSLPWPRVLAIRPTHITGTTRSVILNEQLIHCFSVKTKRRWQAALTVKIELNETGSTNEEKLLRFHSYLCMEQACYLLQDRHQLYKILKREGSLLLIEFLVVYAHQQITAPTSIIVPQVSLWHHSTLCKTAISLSSSENARINLACQQKARNITTL